MDFAFGFLIGFIMGCIACISYYQRNKEKK